MKRFSCFGLWVAGAGFLWVQLLMEYLLPLTPCVLGWVPRGHAMKVVVVLM